LKRGIVGALGWGGGVGDCAERGPQRIDGAGSLGARDGLRLGEHLLDWAEVGAVGGQIEELGAGRLDGGSHARAFVRGRTMGVVRRGKIA
jgi:hypothetical protein